jgi:ketosteroid isomerase-like protein
VTTTASPAPSGALRPHPAWATTGHHITVHGPSTDPDAHLGAGLATRAVLDRVLVVETIYRFAFSFGERDKDVLTDCFTEDACFESNIGGDTPIAPQVGRASLIDWLTSYWPRQTGQRRRLVTNTCVNDLDEHSAVVTAMLALAGSADGAMRLITAGFYRCTLRKEDDGAWRIAHFRAGYDAPY